MKKSEFNSRTYLTLIGIFTRQPNQTVYQLSDEIIKHPDLTAVKSNTILMYLKKLAKKGLITEEYRHIKGIPILHGYFYDENKNRSTIEQHIIAKEEILN